MARFTFSLDDATVALIRQTAARLRTTPSRVVRDAVADCASRAARVGDHQKKMMDTMERLRDARPTRSATSVDDELRSLRIERRGDGRRQRVV